MSQNAQTIVVGSAFDLPVQAWLRGGATKAAFSAGDTLVASVLQQNVSTPIFQPTVTWYTAGNTQTGYGQGQVVVSGTNAQAALLMPRGPYTLVVDWTPSGYSFTEPIARIKLIVEPRAI